MFAKPFIGSLEFGHRDGITCTAASRNALAPFISGAADGELRIWDLASRKLVANVSAHRKGMTGLVFTNDGRGFYSCGDDGKVHSWNIMGDASQDDWQSRYGPNNTYEIQTIGSFKSIDHHRSEHQFATASDNSVDIWNPDMSAPIQSYADLWGSSDTAISVRYNPAERYLLAHTSMDRGVGLFDVRSGTALKKMILKMRCNCIEWNPMEPLNFVVGNEDYNCYSFDMRKMNQPSMIYKGHVGAVMCVNWSPTGREFVSGSYDKSIRIFNSRKGKAREIYHTKRMQRVFTVTYSADNTFIISGSDDTNLRVWKAHASDKIGQTTVRQEWSMEYRKALTKKYEHMPEVERIVKARKVPKLIKKKTSLAQLQKESRDRKLENMMKHDKVGELKFVSDRKTTVVKEVD